MDEPAAVTSIASVLFHRHSAHAWLDGFANWCHHLWYLRQNSDMQSSELWGASGIQLSTGTSVALEVATVGLWLKWFSKSHYLLVGFEAHVDAIHRFALHGHDRKLVTFASDIHICLVSAFDSILVSFSSEP